ncbi:MAG: glycosyltransferase family 4 protein [Bacteroidota bacterium]|nr:glycosyltransferase family 4 protein [Bacteroidota bacterium]
MINNNIKVAYIVKELVPYRVNFFHLIEKNIDGQSLFIIDKEPNAETKELLNDNNFPIRIIGHNIKLPSFIFKQKRFVRYLPIGIIKLLKEYKPDIIICPEYSLQTIFALLYSKLFSAKIIIWCSLTSLDERISFKGQRILRNILRKQADAFICYSKMAYEYLIKRGIKSNKCFVAENCSDVLFFSNMYQAENDKRPNNITRLLYIGALTREKGVDKLLECLSKLNNLNWHMTIIGTGELSNELFQQKEKLFREKLDLLGYIPRKKLPEYYLKSDIFVFPTKSDVWGHVIDEAMALGCSVVSSNKSVAALELIDSGVNGYVYDNDKEDELYNKLKYLLENPKCAREIGLNAIKTMQEHNEENSSKNYIGAIEYVAEKYNK